MRTEQETDQSWLRINPNGFLPFQVQGPFTLRKKDPKEIFLCAMRDWYSLSSKLKAVKFFSSLPMSSLKISNDVKDLITSTLEIFNFFSLNSGLKIK